MKFISKPNWPTFLVLIYILIAFHFAYQKEFTIAGVLTVITGGILASKLDTTINSLKKYWPFLAIFFIFELSVYVRVIDYGWAYLRNIDSYAFFRQMEIIAENGQLFWEDPLYFQPASHIVVDPGFSFPWYQWLGANSYLLVKSFTPDLQLWRHLIYFSPILVSLSVIPMYYIGKILYDKKAGVIAAFLIVFDISNMSRSLAGDPDTDAVVILVPLVVFASFLFVYDRIKKVGKLDRKIIGYSALTGFFLFVWHNTWAGYFYTIWLIIGLLVAKVLTDLIKTRNLKKMWNNMKLYIFGTFIVMLVFFIVDFPIFGFESIKGTVLEPIFFINVKSEELSVFPNVYVSVAELQTIGELRQIIQRITPFNILTEQGTISPAALLSPFMLALYAMFYLAYEFLKRRKYENAFFVVTMWFVGALVATFTATRFTILFAAPIALGIAILISATLNIALKKPEEKSKEEEQSGRSNK